ncbi:MAG: hypothetical protein JJ974_11955, partial [Phycisphaerales bacterium]|nr:hypothetical protein [Phycisphaerales bacterium]
DIKAPETLISSTESMANDLISSPIFSDEFEPTTFQQLSDIPEQQEPTLQPDPESRTTPIPEPASTQPEPAQSDSSPTTVPTSNPTPLPEPDAAIEPKATPSPEPRLHIGSPFGPSIDDAEEPAIHLRDEINQDRPTTPAMTNSAQEQPEQFDLDALRSLDAQPETEDLQSLAIDRAESESIEDESINVIIDEPVESPAIAEQPSESIKQETVGFAEPPKSEAENSALKAEIESLKAMMGQVLDSTRRTAVAVNKTNPDAVLPSAKMSAPLHAMYTEMIDNDVTVELADQFAGAVRDRLDASELENESIVRHAMLTEIESSISTASDSFLTRPESRSQSDRPHVIALIGPTGVGKTTTVAKLAATAKLRHGMNVALITSDTYRIAAVEQLRTYAAIIGLELKIANTPEEIKDEISSLKDVDLIVIDTAGRSQNNHARLDELGSLIESAQPDETHLVLSSTVGENVLRKTADRFRDLGPDRCILTKIDEAVTTGMIAGISDRIGLPLSFVTIGQEVPDDILPARADRLARAVLDGPQAVVPTQEQQQKLAQEST